MSNYRLFVCGSRLATSARRTFYSVVLRFLIAWSSSAINSLDLLRFQLRQMRVFVSRGTSSLEKNEASPSIIAGLYSAYILSERRSGTTPALEICWSSNRSEGGSSNGFNAMKRHIYPINCSSEVAIIIYPIKDCPYFKDHSTIAFFNDN